MNEKEAVATLAAVAAQRNNALNEAAMLAGKVQTLNESIVYFQKESTTLIEENLKLKATIVANERAISRYKKIKPQESEVPDVLPGLPKKLSDVDNPGIVPK